MEPETSTAGPSPASADKKKPTVIITIGMAGAGKSTFVQRINSHLHSQDPPSPPYVLNLDPAVSNTPYEANIDIRDTVDYHKVMKECVFTALLVRRRGRVTNLYRRYFSRYNLGPNGGILTALNLFTTKFDQVLDIIEKRADTVE